MDGMQFQLSEAASQKLTSWKKEPSILDLKTDLEAAKPSHDAQAAKIRDWNDLLQVKGAHKPAKVKGRSSVQPKLIRRQAEWRYSALTEPFLGSPKLFKVSPVTWEDDQAARQNELVLNSQFRTKLNKVRFVDDYVRSTVDDGTAIVRLGWKRVTVPVKETVPVWTLYEIQDEQQLQSLQQAMALKQENPAGFESLDPALKQAVAHYEETQQATVAQQTSTQEVTTEKVLENRPTVEVLNPDNVYIDPSCGGDLSKALFVIISFETSKAELLKAGKKYKNLDQVNWSGNSPATEPNHATTTPADFRLKDTLRNKVVAYEYWGYTDANGDGTLVPFVAAWIGSTIIQMELNPFPDEQPPIVLVPYLPVKRALYGETDAELLEDNQKILGAVTRGMIDLLGRSANGQLGMAKGMLDPLNRKRFDDGKDYEFNPNTHPSQGMLEHKYAELPQSALLMTQMVNQDAEALTGVKSFGGGLSGEAYGEVAAGIRGMLDAASKREMAILRRLAMGMSQIGQKIIAMNGVFLSEKEVVRVTNEEFVTVKREDLKGNFDLEVDISTAEVDNAKAQDMSFMLQTIGPNSEPGLAQMIMGDIAELKRMTVLAHKLRTFQPKPDPIAEQLKQLAVEEAQLKNEKLKSEIALNQAKATRELSQKDQADLDYVEQETGTKHARDMQKQEAQSRGNQALQVTKALTTPIKDGEKRPDVEAAIGFNQVSDKLQGVGG